jgi:hypothetical protein
MNQVSYSRADFAEANRLMRAFVATLYEQIEHLANTFPKNTRDFWLQKSKTAPTILALHEIACTMEAHFWFNKYDFIMSKKAVAKIGRLRDIQNQIDKEAPEVQNGL